MSDGMNYKLLLQDAYRLAVLSPDPSTQIGAFLINSGQQEWLTRNYNRPTANWVMTDADWERPRKYDLMCHAERGAIDNAAIYGICTAGATMIATWAACADCSKGIVACGIKTLVRHSPPDDDASQRWLQSVETGDEILRTGGVEIIDIQGRINGAPPILRSGVLFQP